MVLWHLLVPCAQHNETEGLRLGARKLPCKIEVKCTFFADICRKKKKRKKIGGQKVPSCGREQPSISWSNIQEWAGTELNLLSLGKTREMGPHC